MRVLGIEHLKAQIDCSSAKKEVKARIYTGHIVVLRCRINAAGRYKNASTSSLNFWP